MFGLGLLLDMWRAANHWMICGQRGTSRLVVDGIVVQVFAKRAWRGRQDGPPGLDVSAQADPAAAAKGDIAFARYRGWRFERK
jgi:hypothetical protein